MPSANRSWVYYPIYLTLSAIALYFLRLGPTSKFTGTKLEPLTTGPALNYTYPGKDLVIRRTYTGLGPVDGLLSVLVTAFLAGPMAYKRYIQLQQINFLFSFTAPLVVWSVESVRKRNGWSLIVFTSLWAVFYQTVGGAVIVPLYFIIYTYTSTRANYNQLPSTVPAARASTLIPAVALGFLVPTAMMFYPFEDPNRTMLATAIWQPSPIFINIIWAVLSFFASGSSSPTSSRKYINAAYISSGIVTAVSHLVTLYACFSSRYLDITLQSVFLPIERSDISFPDGIHFIFQIDYLIIFIAFMVWSYQVRPSEKESGMMRILKLVLGSAVIGPAATLAAVWYARENRFSQKKAHKSL